MGILVSLFNTRGSGEVIHNISRSVDIVGYIRGEDGSGGWGSICVHVISIVRITSSSFCIVFHFELSITGLICNIVTCTQFNLIPTRTICNIVSYVYVFVTKITMTAAAISTTTTPLTPALRIIIIPRLGELSSIGWRDRVCELPAVLVIMSERPWLDC